MVDVAGEPLGPVQLITYMPVAETDTEAKLQALLQNPGLVEATT